MIHQPYSLHLPSSPYRPDQAVPECTFFLDYLHLVGRVRQPLTSSQADTRETVDVTFQHWNSPFDTDICLGLNMDLRGSCFRIAEKQNRLVWYIVMHPTTIGTAPRAGARVTALSYTRAQALADYVLRIFQEGELVSRGVSPTWQLNRPNRVSLLLPFWRDFQRRFCDRWNTSFVQEQVDRDPWWAQRLPAFHVYDFGMNIPLGSDVFLRVGI